MPMDRTAAAGGNDRITVALLVQRLDTLIIRLEKLDEKLGKYIETNDIKCNLTNLEIERLKGNQDNFRSDLDVMKRKLETWNILNSIAAAIAVILSVVLAELLR